MHGAELCGWGTVMWVGCSHVGGVLQCDNRVRVTAPVRHHGGGRVHSVRRSSPSLCQTKPSLLSIPSGQTAPDKGSHMWTQYITP